MKDPLAKFVEAKNNDNWYEAGSQFSIIWRYFFDGSLDN
jgi:hypothetical protein